MSVPISEQIMTDGVSHEKYSRFWDETTHTNRYYDFARVVTITLKKDGTQEIKNTTTILKDRGIKDEDYIWFNSAKWGHKKDGSSPFEMRGGIYMTGSGGQGTKYYTNNQVDMIEDIDDLIGALGGLGSQGLVKKNPVVSGEEILKFVKAVSEAENQVDNITRFDEVIDEFEKAITPENSDEQKEKIEGNDLYRCPTCNGEFSPSDTTKHNQDQGRKSGSYTKVQ